MIRPTLAVVILTKNEAIDILACIESCRFADEVVVFDSFSSDDTVSIATGAGATVHKRAFTNYAEQRNAAIDAAAHHQWILMVDADERVPPALAAEVRASIEAAAPEAALYCMRRKDYFQGRWLRRSSGYPTWFGRLLRPNGVRFDRDINEVARTDGTTHYLKEHLDHYPFSKGIAYWIERHNTYSSLEARRLRAERSEPLPLTTNIWNPTERRRLLKQLFYRLPCRPWLAFVGLYVLRGGFLDGRPGFRYCRMRAMYESMIEMKLAELRQ
jgi:glycosyltransferase involved in cell wall biosynthesis